jgi:hypothetical protein
VDRLVSDLLFTKVQEEGQLHTRTLTMSQWSKQPSRLIGSHWTVQVRKPEDLRIEGANPGLEIGFAATALFAAELSLQNASSAIRIYALISERKIILPV